ncbi:hypothetical protein SAMN05216327_102433 [Dyadobacter sp. SG02]|nr:hypothetical protein SAMN05216327_102433 [Dyadobacter sp. SG02]
MIPIIYSNLTMDKSRARMRLAVSTFVQSMGTNVQKEAKTDGFMDKVAFNLSWGKEKNTICSSLLMTIH